jgi:hypothetical protein
LTGSFASIRWRLPALLLGVGGLSLSPHSAFAQAPVVVDTLPLEFLGFRAGLSITEMRDVSTRGGGGNLNCRRSARELRLGECRGSLGSLDAGRSVDLWASVIDGRGAVLTLSGRLTEARFLRWRELLEGRYGTTAERRQGPMRMLQWVRQGQMLRLSWRKRGRDIEASIAIIDGPLLDGWANQGRRPRSTPGAAPVPPAQAPPGD